MQSTRLCGSDLLCIRGRDRLDVNKTKMENGIEVENNGHVVTVTEWEVVGDRIVKAMQIGASSEHGMYEQSLMKEKGRKPPTYGTFEGDGRERRWHLRKQVVVIRPLLVAEPASENR